MLHQMKKSILHSVLVCQKYGKKLKLFFLGFIKLQINFLFLKRERESTWFKKENSNRAEDIFDHPNFLMATTLEGIGQRTQKLFLSIVICFRLIIPSWNYTFCPKEFLNFPFISHSFADPRNIMIKIANQENKKCFKFLRFWRGSR